MESRVRDWPSYEVASLSYKNLYSQLGFLLNQSLSQWVMVRLRTLFSLVPTFFSWVSTWVLTCMSNDDWSWLPKILSLCWHHPTIWITLNVLLWSKIERDDSAHHAQPSHNITENWLLLNVKLVTEARTVTFQSTCSSSTFSCNLRWHFSQYLLIPLPLSIALSSTNNTWSTLNVHYSMHSTLYIWMHVIKYLYALKYIYFILSESTHVLVRALQRNRNNHIYDINYYIII